MARIVKRAMILAAGLGTRLRPLTEERPKPLAEVLGTPLLFHTLSHLRRAGIEEVVLNTHHLGAQIQSAMTLESELIIRIIDEPQILGTGGGVKNAEHLLRDRDSPFLLINADSFLDLDLNRLINAHLESRASVTMLLKNVADVDAYGGVETDQEGKVIAIENHFAMPGKSESRRMFCGVHICNPEVFDELPEKGTPCGIFDAYSRLAHKGKRIFSMEQVGYFSDVGTPLRLFETNMDALKNPRLFEHSDLLTRFREDKKYPGVFFGKNAVIDPAASIIPPAVIDDDAVIESSAQIGPCVVVGKRARVKTRAHVQESILLSDAVLQDGQFLRRQIKGTDTITALS